MTGIPADRYGARGRGTSGKALALILGAAGVVLAAGVVWVAWQQWGRSDLEALVTGYRSISAEQTEVRLSVTRDDPSKPAVCLVRAMTPDRFEVGRRELLIEPSESKTIDITTMVATASRGAVGDLYGCGWEVPNYLRPATN